MARLGGISAGPVTGEPPATVRRLAEERAAARARRAYVEADRLRERIRQLGWEPVDRPGGTELRPALSAAASDRVAYARPEDLESLLADPPTVDASLVITAEDHPGDLSRALAGLARQPRSIAIEVLVVANAASFEVDNVVDATPVIAAQAPVVLRMGARLGWADAVNAGLRRTRGAVAIVLDSSLEPLGDFVSPLLAAFDDQTVGLAGPWGVTSPDLREFHEAPAGEVEAIEAYCLAVRREVLLEVGLFDPHFRFYRNADLDFSFAARAAGWRALRTGPLPVQLHEHRGWTAYPPAERDRLSRRNFYRFLRRWGRRRDLLLDPGSRPDRSRS